MSDLNPGDGAGLYRRLCCPLVAARRARRRAQHFFFPPAFFLFYRFKPKMYNSSDRISLKCKILKINDRDNLRRYKEISDKAGRQVRSPSCVYSAVYKGFEL